MSNTSFQIIETGELFIIYPNRHISSKHYYTDIENVIPRNVSPEYHNSIAMSNLLTLKSIYEIRTLSNN